MSHEPKSTGVALVASELAASAAPGGNSGRTVTMRDIHENTAMPSGSARIIAPVSIAMNTAIVRRPILPTVPTLEAEATPVITSETMSGITVMRMALIQSPPIGATASAALSSVGLCEAAIARPAPRPTPRPTRTRVPSLIHCSYIMRSPPLMSRDAPVM